MAADNQSPSEQPQGQSNSNASPTGSSTSAPSTTGAGRGAPNVPRQPKRVEVLVDNLGPDLLKKGSITGDERVVALLRSPNGRKLVREVKG